MTRDDSPVLVAVIALMLVFLFGGVVGWSAHALKGRGSPPLAGDVRQGAPVLSAPEVPLRCTNAASPRPWTQLDAEVAVHRAQVALDTALASAWVEKRMMQWTGYAQATLDLVRVCWR